MDERVVTGDELKRIAQRDLTFQRFVHRRSWGVQYAIWAAVMACFVIMPGPAYLLHLQGDLARILDLLVCMAIVLIAVLSATRSMKICDRESELRMALTNDHSKRSKRARGISWVLAVFTVTIIASVLIPTYTSAVLYLALTPIAAHINPSLMRMFQARPPIEGIIAARTFLAAVVLSFVVSLTGADWSSDTTVVLWVITAVVWFSASVYALFHAPDELGGFNEE